MRWALLLLPLAALAADPVPEGWRIPWDPGVRGGIPTNGILYTNITTTNITTAAIQTLINSASTAGLADGTNRIIKFDFTNTLWVTARLQVKSRVILRGSGMSNTVLTGTAVFSGDRFFDFDDSFDYDYNAATARDIIGTVAKGDSAIQTSVAHGWTVGDIILIDMKQQTNGDPPISVTGSLGDCDWCGRPYNAAERPIGQRVKVLTVPTSTEITFEPALYWTYTNSPQGIKLINLTHYAGVEDLTVDNLTSSSRDTFGTWGAINCWLYNVMLKGNDRRAMWGYDALWCELRRVWVVGGVPIGNDRDAQYTSDHAYGPFLGGWTAGLITDCIFEKLTMGVAFEGPSAGNVVSYCLMTNIWWQNDGGSSPRRFGPLMHGPHPFMNLIEGNYTGGRVRADEYWGTSSHFTVLRNRVIQVDRGASDAQTWTVDVERRNWYWSFVGNLLGGTEAGGTETNYEYINGETTTGGVSTIWKLGYKSLGSDADLYDTDGLLSTIRWKNWTYRTNDSISGSGVTYHTNNIADPSDTTTLTNSYYLASKPSFFGALAWPPYDPGAPTVNSATNIPAGHRYYLGTEAPEGEGGGGESGPAPAERAVIGGSVSVGGGVTLAN